MFSKPLFSVNWFNQIKQSMGIGGGWSNLENLKEYSDSQAKLSSQRKYTDTIWFPSNTKTYTLLTFHFTYSSKTKDKLSIPLIIQVLISIFSGNSEVIIYFQV